MVAHNQLENGLPTAHERRKEEGRDSCDGERDGQAGVRQVALDTPIELFLCEEHTLVVQTAQDAAYDAEQNQQEVVLVRQIANEDETYHRFEPQHLADKIVGCDRARHDRQDQGGRELLMDLLEREENARKRGAEGRGHAGRGAAGHEETLLSPTAFEAAGNRLAGDGAELDAGALAAERETCEGAERALDELDGQNAVPRHIDLAHDLGVGLRYARPLRIGLPHHELADDDADQGEQREPSGNEQCVSRRGTREGAERTLGHGERPTVERNDAPADDADQKTLPDQFELERRREPVTDGGGGSA